MMVEHRCRTLLPLMAIALLEISGVNSIVGGSTSMPGKAPYIVALHEVAGSSFTCAGVLVKSNWVLTTARCVTDKTEADLAVVAGSNRLLTNKKAHSISKIVRNPTYDATTGAHNLALLELAESITLSERIRTIVLNDATATAGTVTAFYGWGALAYGSTSYSNILQVLLQRVLPTTECLTRIKSLADGDICTFIQLGQAACTKDEGGPLVQYGTEKLVGIHSYNTQCTGRLPDVFVDVYTHKLWIESVAI